MIMEKRIINCDLMRVSAMIFMIEVHTNNLFKARSLYVVFLSTILFACNNLFYMLSGRFNLIKYFK